MRRVTRANAVAARPAPPASAGPPGFFTGGNPLAGQEATTPGYEWFNAVQEELAEVVAGAGLSLDPNDDTQLLTALRRLCTGLILSSRVNFIPARNSQYPLPLTFIPPADGDLLLDTVALTGLTQPGTVSLDIEVSGTLLVSDFTPLTVVVRAVREVSRGVPVTCEAILTTADVPGAWSDISHTFTAVFVPRF